MGTRSVVARPLATGGWQGRYVHWDGYPSGVGEAVRQIVNRDGLDVARETLLAHDWSSIDAEAWRQSAVAGEPVKGYGMAYPDSHDVIRHTGDSLGTEWAYVMRSDGIDVHRRLWKREAWQRVGTVAYGDAEGMDKIEAAMRDE